MLNLSITQESAAHRILQGRAETDSWFFFSSVVVECYASWLVNGVNNRFVKDLYFV